MKNTFGFIPVWDYKAAVARVVEWMVEYKQGEDVSVIMARQIEEYIADRQRSILNN